MASSGEETTTRLQCRMRRRKQSSNFLARSVRLRWLRSSLTCSQFPKTGTGMGPSGSLNFLLAMTTMTATKRLQEEEVHFWGRVGVVSGFGGCTERRRRRSAKKKGY